MRLPSEIQFHQDIRLLIYQPRGLIGETALNSVIRVIEDLDAATQGVARETGAHPYIVCDSHPSRWPARKAIGLNHAGQELEHNPAFRRAVTTLVRQELEAGRF